MKEDKWIGFIIIAFSAFMYYQADLLPPPLFGTLGAAMFPKIVLALLFLAGGGLILQCLVKERRGTVEAKTTLAKKVEKINKGLIDYEWVILSFFCFFCYVLLMDFFGYLPSTLIFVPSLMWLIGPRTKGSLWVIVITTLIMTFGLYHGFTTFFDIFLPEGRFF